MAKPQFRDYLEKAKKHLAQISEEAAKERNEAEELLIDAKIISRSVNNQFSVMPFK